MKRDENNRNVAKDLQVSQSWVAQFCKQHLIELSDVNCNFGGKPQVHSATSHMACVREITVGGLETAYKVGNYMKEELYRDSTLWRVLPKGGLKCKVKEKKPKLRLLQNKGRLEFARCHCHWIDDDWNCVASSHETKIK